ncbi:MAG TPA: hypothetical protein PKD86_14540, partial [Gemmatales bacterium]|nr:hypothetical protein [Gemmatales bacterium]
MRSIRGTLLWLILALVAVVLGIVSWFVYHDASHTLLTREAAMRELLVAGMVRQSAETRDYYDDQLLRRAQRIASRSQLLRGQPRYLMLGALATLAVPDGAVPSLAWLAQGVDSPISREVQRTSTIVVTEELLPRPDDVGTDHEFCAIWSEGGRLLQHSMTLEGHELILDPVMRQSLTLSEYFFEDARLPSGTPLRVVTLKAMVTGLRDSPGRLMFFRMPQQNTRPGPNAQRPVPTRQPIPNAASPPLFTFPSILVQYARETIECDARLAEIAQAFDRDVKELRRDTDATLAGLRLRLILTSLVAFILAAAGGTWLVHRSLVPVGRIADAVSRVSPTDFQLHIDRRDVP